MGGRRIGWRQIANNITVPHGVGLNQWLFLYSDINEFSTLFFVNDVIGI